MLYNIEIIIVTIGQYDVTSPYCVYFLPHKILFHPGRKLITYHLSSGHWCMYKPGLYWKRR